MRPLLALVLFLSSGIADADISKAELASKTLCSSIGYSGKPEHAKSCTNGNNKRTIECMPGFVVSGTQIATITIDGRAPFPGCVKAFVDMCAKFGYSGKQEHVESCSNGDNLRTITCQQGFVVAGTTDRVIRLVGERVFPGCVAAPPTPSPTDMCAKFGYSGKPEHVESCVNGDKLRTVTCQQGFVAAGTTERSIRLVGDAAFPGCVAPGTSTLKPPRK